MTPSRSKKYLAFVRRLPCCACGSRKNVEAAHGPNAGMSRKGSDFDAVPLCAICHRTGAYSQHNITWRKFVELWDLDLDLIRADLCERFERAA